MLSCCVVMGEKEMGDEITLALKRDLRWGAACHAAARAGEGEWEGAPSARGIMGQWSTGAFGRVMADPLAPS